MRVNLRPGARPSQTRRYRVYSRACDWRDSETSALKDANPKHRAAIEAGAPQGRAGFAGRSAPLRFANLTRARLDGLVQPRRFADRNGRTAGFGSKTSWSPIATPSGRRHPEGAERKRSTRHGAARADIVLHVPSRLHGGLTAIGRRGAVLLKTSQIAGPRRSPFSDSPARAGRTRKRRAAIRDAARYARRSLCASPR